MPEPSRDTLVTRGPGKALVTFFTIAINAAKLPFWMIWFLPQFTRQHPNWTWKQAVRARIVSAFLYWSSLVETKTPMDLEPGIEKERWVLTSPAKKNYYAGIVIQDSEIKPITIGGTWYPKLPQKSDTGIVNLHFHGGAYVIDTGRKKDCAFLASTILKNAEVAYVFCPQYRLASNPGGRFPAALQDAITSYTYLVETMGISPDRIVIGGDSAGGNLSMAFLRYMSENTESFPLGAPKCAWMWSPWMNPMNPFENPDSIYSSPNLGTDYVNAKFENWGAQCFAPGPNSGIPRSSPYIRFTKDGFKVGCPVWVSAGSGEILYHDIIQFYDTFKKVPGNKFDLSIEEHAPHDIILVGELMAWEAEAANATRKAGKFLKSL